MGFLTHRLAGTIGAGLAILLLAILTYVTINKNATIGELRGANATLTKARDEAMSDLAQCRSNRLTLEDALQRQNAAIAAARAAGEARAAELDRITEDARRNAASAEARARAILNRPGTGNVCADAEALILETVNG